MKISKWQFWTAVTFLALSAIFYIIHFIVFRDLHHIILYLIGDLAFVFIQVLLVTLILENHLEKREKKMRLEKLNMVIGVFFSELGTDMLHLFANGNPQIENIRNDLMLSNDWSKKKFSVTKSKLKTHCFDLKLESKEFETLLKNFELKSNFLLRLLENPTLMEHESFTDLLQASFHLYEELKHRKEFTQLPASDIKHLQGDCQRVYTIIVLEWLNYMEYLKANYPYLFSLGMRTNPFQKNGSVIITE